MTQPPRWLADALAANPPRPQRPVRVRPYPGQIWLAVADDGPRVHLLVVAGCGDRLWQVLLCGCDDDLATDTDAVLDPALTGAPYRLLVHGDLTVPVPERRLWRMVGDVSPGVLRRVCARGYDLDNGPGLGRGLPIRERADARRAFKEQELERLYTVAAVPDEAGW